MLSEGEVRPRDDRGCRWHPGEVDIGDRTVVTREEPLEGTLTATVGLWGGSGWAAQPLVLGEKGYYE